MKSLQSKAPKATAEHGVRPPAAEPAGPGKGSPRTSNRATARLFSEGQGRPLEPGLRQQMEAGLDADLSGVRVHTGQQGEKAAHALKARAATYGTDVMFARGAYAPGSAEGRHLIAHEMAHVVQQSGGIGPAPTPDPNGPAESDAARVASTVAAGGKAKVQAHTAPGIARQVAAPVQTPAAGGREGVAKLENALRVLDSIKQVGTNDYEVSIDGQIRHLTKADVDAAFAKTRAGLRSSLSSIRIKAEGAIEGYQAQSQVDDDFPVISRAVKFFGSIDDPGEEIRGYAVRSFQLVFASLAQLELGHFENAGRLMALAETQARIADRKYHDYHDDIISTGEKTITVLEYTEAAAFVTLAVVATVATAGAAAGLTSVAGVEIGSATAANSIALFTPLTAKFAQAGVKLAYGDKVDWGQLAVEAVVTIVVAKFAPQLANSIAGKIIGQSPAAASLGRHVVGSIVGGVVTGRGAAVLNSTVSALYSKYQGKDITWEQFVDQTASALTDPKSAALDLMLSAVGGYGAGRGAPGAIGGPGVHETPSASQTEPPAPKTVAKPAIDRPAVPKPVEATVVKPPAEPVVKAPAPPQVKAPAPKLPEATAPKTPQVKGPVVEETRVRPTVIRRRRGPADPAAAPPEAKPVQTEPKPPSRAQRKANMAAEARAEMKAHSEYERENATPESVPEEIDEVRDRPDLRESDIHSPTHPEILGAALERAGMPRLPGHDPHHIVPTSGGGQAGERARAVIDRAGIHGDEADNGVWLPRTTIDPRTIPQPAPIDPRFPQEGLARHQTIHTNRYYEEIAARLEAAEGKRSIRDTLRDIRTEIADGKFPQ